jgi:hypothetical protein
MRWLGARIGSDPGVTPYGYFFMVMPTLIGGFLRRGRDNSNIFFN